MKWSIFTYFDEYLRNKVDLSTDSNTKYFANLIRKILILYLNNWKYFISNRTGNNYVNADNIKRLYFSILNSPECSDY